MNPSLAVQPQPVIDSVSKSFVSLHAYALAAVLGGEPNAEDGVGS
jgi:hypothetical protein